MLQLQPVPTVYATGPIRRPKPIKLMTDPDGRIQSVPHTPVQPLPPQNRHKRPSMVRAATLDGRSLSEVIDAAHRASLNERSKSRSSKSPVSINSDSRRTSLHYCPPSHPIPPTTTSSSTTNRSSNIDYNRFKRPSCSYENNPEVTMSPFELYRYQGLA